VVSDVLVISAVSLIFLGLSWSSARSINLGKPLSDLQRKMLFWSFLFIWGSGCIMAISTALNYSDALMFSIIAGWAILLAGLAFRFWKSN
jgi:hypothetical protein